jgi:hypothetical protein
MDKLFFWIIVLLVPVFGWTQCEKMLTSTQGVSISMFLLAGLFTVTLTWLAVSAFIKQRNKMSLQIVIIYLLGVLVYVSMIVVAVIKGQYQWDGRDTLATILVSILVIVIIKVAYHKNLKWHDPIVKGFLALTVRVVPNLMMATKIWVSGGSGVSLWFVVIYNTLTLLRITQIVLTAGKNGWNRNLRGMIIGEIGNLLSWLVVTVVWVIK